ncbi:MAG: ABC transporter permease [Propionibacteriaceae bacterium]|nr:ABC transporter permease [Propionibacteriaceae bacterium]
MSENTARASFDASAFVRKYAILLILIGFAAILGVATGGKFLALSNLSNVVVQVAPIGIIALGMMFAIITKGIDLSVGATAALAGVAAASLAQVPGPTAFFPNLPALPVALSVVLGLLVGALAGGVIGALVAIFKIPPFVATLGMMTAARGLALIYSDGRPISNLAPNFNALGKGIMPILLFAIAAAIIWVILNRTRFGRHVYAIGGNEQAARVSGISISKAHFFIYTLIGLLAGLAGIILAARVESGGPTAGTMMELDVITATVIGGTSFAGGIGTVWGVIVGALIIGVINNGLDLLNVSPYLRMVVKGVIIVIAIIIDERKNR